MVLLFRVRRTDLPIIRPALALDLFSSSRGRTCGPSGRKQGNGKLTDGPCIPRKQGSGTRRSRGRSFGHMPLNPVPLLHCGSNLIQITASLIDVHSRNQATESDKSTVYIYAVVYMQTHREFRNPSIRCASFLYSTNTRTRFLKRAQGRETHKGRKMS